MISIIIPTHMEEKYLPRLLESLKRQTDRDFEVIVVDWNSKDRTREIARKYGCKLVIAEKRGIGRGRNLGAKHAKGDVLAFIDADIVLPPNFVEEVKGVKCNAAICEWIPLEDDLLLKLYYRISYLFCKLFNLLGIGHSPGFCTIIRRDIFERVGGYNEELLAGEDHELARRVRKLTKICHLKVKIKMDSRRVRKEGKFGIVWKYTVAEVKGLLGKKVGSYEIAR